MQRVKSKVGRKLPPPTNATKTDFKSKGLHPTGEELVARVEFLFIYFFLRACLCYGGCWQLLNVGIGGAAIVIPGQSVAADKDGVAVNQRNQTLKELLTQSMHYSEKVRKGTRLDSFRDC